MLNDIIKIADVSDFVRHLTKIKKKYPESIIVYDGDSVPSQVTRLAVGFIKRDIPLTQASTKAIRFSDYEKVTNTEDYQTLIFLG